MSETCKICGDRWNQEHGVPRILKADGTIDEVLTEGYRELQAHLPKNSLVKTTYQGVECFICVSCGIDLYPIGAHLGDEYEQD